MHREPPARSGRRRRAVLLGVLLALLAFECALQITAYWLWRHAGREGAGAAGDREQVVLCVGDSFTYGLGSSTSSRSYPAQLQRRLDAARPGVFRVVNAGRPGQSSADVLRRLPQQLADQRPSVVVVLAGYNDRFKKPAAVDRAELAKPVAAETFPWRWRSLELAGRLLGALTGDAPGAPPPASELYGAWEGAGLRIWFGRDGICTVAGIETRFRVEGAGLELGSGSEAMQLRWERRGEGLWLAGGSLQDGGVELRPAPADPADLAPRSGRKLLEDPSTLEKLDADAVRTACSFLREHPEDSPTWWSVAAAAARGIAADDVLDTVAVALAAVPAQDPWRAGLLRIRAGIVEGRDPSLALASILEAALVDGQAETVASFLETRAKDAPREAFDRALARLSPEPPQRARLEAMFEAVVVPEEQLVEILAGHLELAAALCQEADCAALIATYPEREPLVDRAIRRGAALAGQDPVDLSAVFDTALAGRPRDGLFVMDGHCNDAGYALVAATVAARLLD